MSYSAGMFEVIQSDAFSAWLNGLRDRAAASRVRARLRRAALGNLGDAKPLREGVQEMRIDHGAGYRLYFTRHGHTVVILLCGGDKRTQDADIRRAIALSKNWKE